MFSLIPKQIYESVTALTPKKLRELEISVLLMDFDNTIVPYTCDNPTDQVAAWLDTLKREGFALCVVSNTKRGRAMEFCKKWNIDCITRAKKPFPNGIRQAMCLYHERTGKIALVGDQIFTDVLGANCAGIMSILIRPIHLHNIWLKLRHVAELPFIAIGKGRNNEKSRL